MKTQIITLESHDDPASIRDRMSWAKSPRILLVWAGIDRVGLRPLDLRTLQQHARYLGADLGLVTRSREIRREAEGFGIPVFPSTAAAQRQPWLVSHRSGGGVGLRRTGGTRRPALHSMKQALRLRYREPRWTSGPIARIAFFVFGVLAVLSVVGLFVPRASIKLNPVSMQQSMSLGVEASASAPSQLVTGGVPLHEIEVVVDGTQSARIASQAKVAQDQAQGVAHFTNLTQTAIVIPAGTVVFSVSPLAARFATAADATLPGNVNAFVDVPIHALQAGEGSNVPANAILGIEGSLGASASVSNPNPTTGGSERLMNVPSLADRERVRGVLIQLMETKAEAQVRAMIEPEDVILPNTLDLKQNQQELYDPPAGQPGSLLTLTMRLEYAAQYVEAHDLQQLAKANLDASIPEGFRAAPDTLTFSMASAPTLDSSGIAHFDLNVQRQVVREVDSSRASALVRGLSPNAAADLLLSTLPLASQPEIRINPSWWPWLPLIPFRIDMNVP